MNVLKWFSAVVAMVFLPVHTAAFDRKLSKDSALVLSDIVVTGARTKIDSRHLPYNVSVVDRLTLTAKHQENILPTLSQYVPGLFVTSRGMFGYGVSTGGSGDISLRGLGAGSGRLMVLVDGHPQYQGIFGHAIADSYQTLMAERVEVLRGPASTLYGSNAMGGVVNIVTRQMQQDGVHTQAGFSMGSFNTIQADVANQYRKGKFYINSAAQYAVTQNHRPNMGFEQYGGFLKLGYDFSNHWNAFVDAHLTHFNASNPGTVQQPKLQNDQYITRGVANICLENHYDKFNGALSIYNNFGIHKINDGYAPGGKPQTSYFRSRDALCGFNLYETMSLWKGDAITIGLDYQYIYGRAFYTSIQTGEELPPTPAATKQNLHEVAPYIQWRQDISSWLTLDAGVRYDHHTITGGEWIPQGGLVVRPCQTGELKASVSKGFRNPTMKDLYLYKPANEALRPERLINYELSWHQRLKQVSYGVNIFYMNADNLIQTVAMKNINTGEVKNCGMEADLRWFINNHWSLTTNHTYLHMKNPVVAAPEYKGFLSVDMRYGKWTASVGFQQLCGLYTDVEKDVKTNASLLDATVGYRPHHSVQFFVRGENLLAQRYEINAGYPMPKATAMGGVRVSF